MEIVKEGKGRGAFSHQKTAQHSASLTASGAERRGPRAVSRGGQYRQYAVHYWAGPGRVGGVVNMEITPPSDAEITEKLGELVRGADFDAVTVKVLRLQLQQCFSGQDLSHRKAFIKTVGTAPTGWMDLHLMPLPFMLQAIKSIIAQQDAAEAEKEKEEKNADESACSGLSDSS
jgi:hypothetical protein